MRKAKDILHNFFPIFAGTRKHGKDDIPVPNHIEKGRWEGVPKYDWQVVDDGAELREAFIHLRETLFDWNRKTKASWNQPSKMRAETGVLQGLRPYFFLQPWNEMGFLFELTQRGWVVARAEKIVGSERFMRERAAWDHVVIYATAAHGGSMRAKSEQLGEEMISLALYEDAMLRLFTEWYR